MKNIAIIILCILVTGCSMQRRFNKKHPVTSSSSNINDSTVISTYYVKRDTTIYQIVEVPNFVTHDSAVVHYINGYANVEPLYLKGNFSTANVWIMNGVLKGVLSEGGFMPARVKLVMMDKYIKEYKSHEKSEAKIIETIRNSQIAKIALWIVGIQLLIILVYVIYRILKFYLKFTIPPINFLQRFRK